MTGRRWSEHAFGNALDIERFSFDPIDGPSLAKLQARGVELDPAARRAFRVRVGPAWSAQGRAIDKRFFTSLLERLRARADIFRGLIGPPDPGHTTHLHFDTGPWSYGRFTLP